MGNWTLKDKAIFTGVQGFVDVNHPEQYKFYRVVDIETLRKKLIKDFLDPKVADEIWTNLETVIGEFETKHTDRQNWTDALVEEIIRIINRRFGVEFR